MGLSEQRNTRVGKLSGGQRRRLDMAVGLAGDPALLFLGLRLGDLEVTRASLEDVYLELTREAEQGGTLQ